MSNSPSSPSSHLPGNAQISNTSSHSSIEHKEDSKTGLGTPNEYSQIVSDTPDSDGSDSEDMYEYPEDMKKCWLVVFGSFMGLIPAWGIANSIGVIQTRILENELRGAGTTTVSWVFSVFSCLSMVCATFSGKYFDRNGPKVPIIVGTVLTAGSLFAVANCSEAWQFILAFGVGVGIGCGILGAPLIGSVPHFIPKNQRATAMGVAGNGGCVGGLLFPVMLRKSYTTIGYAWSMRVMGFITLFCLTVSFFLVKERQLVERKTLTRAEAVHSYLTSSFDFKVLLKDRKYFFNVIGCVFAECTIVVSAGYFSFVCVESGFSQSQAFLFVTLTNACAIPSRWICGILADRVFGPYNLMIGILLMTSVSELVAWLPFKSNLAAMYAYSVLYGICSGGIMSLVPSCCSQVVPQEHFGARYATQYAITGITLLGVMPSGSAIIGTGLSPMRNTGFIIFTSCLGIVGALGYFVTRGLSVGLRLRKF